MTHRISTNTLKADIIETAMAQVQKGEPDYVAKAFARLTSADGLSEDAAYRLIGSALLTESLATLHDNREFSDDNYRRLLDELEPTEP